MDHIQEMNFITFITHLKNRTIPHIELKQKPRIVRSVAISAINTESILFSIYMNRDHLNYFTIDNMIKGMLSNKTIGTFYKDLENEYNKILFKELSYENEEEECIKRIHSISTDDSEFSDTTSLSNSSIFSCDDENYCTSWYY